jgi:hypothetical protein
MVKTILLIDSGATNSNWKFIDGKFNEEVLRFQGFNLSTNTIDSFNFPIPDKYIGQISHVFFFGAGTGDALKEKLLKDKLKDLLLGNPKIVVGSDLLTAALALSGGQRSVISILGTGSNCCVFDGQKIEQNINNLGFILGDEGSGYQIGRSILRDYFYNRMPSVDAKIFEEEYKINRNDLIRKVYHEGGQPNKYIASFCSFTKKCSIEYRKAKSHDALGSFFSEQLSQFDNTSKIPHHFSGSISWHFQEDIRELCSNNGYNLGKIIQNPLDSLSYSKIVQFI